ncbi:MAG TPA: hypothetical protein VJ964_14470 [Balneolaceae bacterium]|nr:hypothetical protein [Balneolaceae bacterium]
MVGTAEVIETMAAMVIFSLILLSANRMIIRNTNMQVQGEVEQEVVALAQNIIEESRTKEFDELSKGAAPPAHIPGDFTAPGSLGPDDEAADPDDPNSDDDLNKDGTYQRSEFDDFDDYNGWEDTITTEHGQFKIWAKVFYVNTSTYTKSSSRTTFKKIQVFVSSKYLNKSSSDSAKYHFEFIRNYYAD